MSICKKFDLLQAELAQLERSRKAAEKSDREKARTKARRAAAANNPVPGVPEWIPDCVASAYKPKTKSAAGKKSTSDKKGKKSVAATSLAASRSATSRAKVATRRTAKEQADYERTMASLDRIIGKNAEDALQELEDEEEEENDSRPITRGRNKKKD